MRGVGQAIDRVTKACSRFYQLRSHCWFLGMHSPQVRTNLACAFGSSTLLFGCVVWGHALGPDLALTVPTGKKVSQVDHLHRSLLRWGIKAPSHIRNSILYLLCHTLPVTGLVAKQYI